MAKQTDHIGDNKEIIVMTYQEAQKKSLTVRWKTNVCGQGEVCWCRIIEPETPILFLDGEIESELYIVSSGGTNKEAAEHIVRVHNDFIKNK